MNHMTNNSHSGEPYYPVRVPHLDVLDGADFLSYPFYSTCNTDKMLPAPDGDDRRTVWIKETWMPFVFAHTGYAHCESFYEPTIKFIEKAAKS